MILSTYKNKKYNRVVFLDSENVCEKGLYCIKALEKDDIIIVFHSSRSFKLSLSNVNLLVNAKCEVATYEVNTNTQNAMDFCIVSELGYLIAYLDTKQFIIISNDKGYTPVVHNWRHRGYDVRLLGRSELILYSPNSVIVQNEKADKLVESGQEREKQLEKEKKEQALKEKIENLELKNEQFKNNIDEIIEHNRTILVNKVNKFGLAKEKQILSIITTSDNFDGAKDKLTNIIKRNRDKYLRDISINWSSFKHTSN